MTQRPGLALDWALLLVVVGLLLFSLALVYSASAAVGVWKFGSSQYFLERHAVRVGLSIVLLLVCAWVDYRHWQRLSGLLLWIGIGLLLLVLVLGEPVKGAARWLQIGPLRFQPSEYIKFALLLHMARLLAQEPVARRPPSAKRPLVWLLLCCALIAAQPNASVAVLLALVGMLLLLSGGVRWTTLSGVALLGVLALGVYLVAAPYRMARLASFSRVRPSPTKRGRRCWHSDTGGFWALVQDRACSGSSSYRKPTVISCLPLSGRSTASWERRWSSLPLPCCCGGGCV